MAVRAIIGFDHLPQNTTNWINYVDHGLTRAADLSQQNTIVNGWIVSNSPAAGIERVTIPLDRYMAAPVSKIWFGVRARIVKNVNGAAGIFYLNASYQFIVNDIPGVANGTIAYLEVSYDIATGAVERWVNGNKITNGTSLAAGLRTVTAGLEAKGSVANNIDWRDIYICDDQGAAQGQPLGPLGPQVVYPITFDAVTGPDWTTTPSSASLLTAISEPGAVPTANIATSALTKGLLTASMKATLPGGVSVSAIQVTGGVSSPSGSATNCGTKLKNGSNELQGKTLQAPLGTYNYDADLGIFHKAPDGTQWNNASIDATDLILTPDV